MATLRIVPAGKISSKQWERFESFLFWAEWMVSWSFTFFLLGIPKPAVKWLRNGRELTGSEPGISVLEDGTLLVIASVTPSDNGEYICVATNEAGRTERKYNLKVHGK